VANPLPDFLEIKDIIDAGRLSGWVKMTGFTIELIVMIWFVCLLCPKQGWQKTFIFKWWFV
jgi:hypothetical protein